MSVEAFVGAPGSGKTTLALAKYECVLSPWSEAGELWCPPGDGNLQKALTHLYKRGKRKILVDEAEMYFLSDPKLVKGISGLVQQTRHLKMEIGFTSKRPFCIPPAIFGCHQRLYLFRLGLQSDTRIFKQWVDPDRILNLPNFTYVLIERGEVKGEFQTEKP